MRNQRSPLFLALALTIAAVCGAVAVKALTNGPAYADGIAVYS